MIENLGSAFKTKNHIGNFFRVSRTLSILSKLLTGFFQKEIENWLLGCVVEKNSYNDIPVTVFRLSKGYDEIFGKKKPVSLSFWKYGHSKKTSVIILFFFKLNSSFIRYFVHQWQKYCRGLLRTLMYTVLNALYHYSIKVYKNTSIIANL